MEIRHKFHSPSLEVPGLCFNVSLSLLCLLQEKKLRSHLPQLSSPKEKLFFQIPCYRPSIQYLLTLPPPPPHTHPGNFVYLPRPCVQLLPFNILALYMALKTGISALGRETLGKEQNILYFFLVLT